MNDIPMKDDIESKVTLVAADMGGGKIIGFRELYDKKEPNKAYYLYRVERVKVLDKNKKGSVRVGVQIDKITNQYTVFIMSTNDRKKLKKMVMKKGEASG